MHSIRGRHQTKRPYEASASTQQWPFLTTYFDDGIPS